MNDSLDARVIDLRSDTVTKPIPEMLKAMSKAELGDDVYGEDPTVNTLEAISANKMGKEAALFVPSGTMANLIACLVHCRRGDEIIMGDQAHTFLYEGGGVSALGGIVVHTITNEADGTLVPDQIRLAIRPDDIHQPRTRLIILENTHNRCGGVYLTPEYIQGISEIAKENQLGLHIDGARIFNAAIAQNVEPKSLVDHADSVAFCLSKGLCAPVGSVLCGTNHFISEARRIRKQLGGGMRQAGVIAAAGIVALDTMINRLAEDHERANRLADGLKHIEGIIIEKKPNATNMVFLTIANDQKITAFKLANRLRSCNVLVGAVSEKRLRMVTHYWITDQDLLTAVNVMRNKMMNE